MFRRVFINFKSLDTRTKTKENSPALEYPGTKRAKLLRLKELWCQNAHFSALVTVPMMRYRPHGLARQCQEGMAS